MSSRVCWSRCSQVWRDIGDPDPRLPGSLLAIRASRSWSCDAGQFFSLLTPRWVATTRRQRRAGPTRSVSHLFSRSFPPLAAVTASGPASDTRQVIATRLPLTVSRKRRRSGAHSAVMLKLSLPFPNCRERERRQHDRAGPAGTDAARHAGGAGHRFGGHDVLAGGAAAGSQGADRYAGPQAGCAARCAHPRFGVARPAWVQNPLSCYVRRTSAK